MGGCASTTTTTTTATVTPTTIVAIVTMMETEKSPRLRKDRECDVLARFVD